MRKHAEPPYNTPFLPFPDGAAQTCAASPERGPFYMQIRLNLEDINWMADAYNPALQPSLGTTIDAIPPIPAPPPRISAENLQTLHDLLTALAADPACKGVLPMLKTTTNRLMEYLKRPADQIQIAELSTALPGFKAHLDERRYKPCAVTSYLNYVKALLRKAKRCGWSEIDPELQAAWRPIWDARPKKPSCSSVIRFALRNGIRPERFGDADLDRWETEVLAQRKMSASNAGDIKSHFRSFVFSARFATALTKPVERPGGRCYRIPFDDLPSTLRAQIGELRHYKQAKYFPGRPNKCRHRPKTFDEVRDLICRIAGYLRLRGKEARTLEDIVCKPTMEGYVDFQINGRGNQGTALQTWLGILLNSARRFPALSHLDFAWVPAFLESIPTDGDERRKQEKKQRKWITYDEFCAIAPKIHEERMQLTHAKPGKLALLARNEFLAMFLQQLIWRERNLIECVVAPRAEGGNLFKEPLPEPSTKARPQWVEEELRLNPTATFWQYRFEPEETKATDDRCIEALVPRAFVPLLEEYLYIHRPVLVRGNEPKTLFVNFRGGRLSPEGMYTIIGNMTQRYAGRSINPHLIRDIFDVGWLKAHPGDYVTPSKASWHKSPRMLERVYGVNYDESYAGMNIEDWHERTRAPIANVFAEMRVVASQLVDQQRRELLLRHIAALEQAKGTEHFPSRYQDFIGALGTQITLFTRVLAALTRYLHDAT